MSAPVERFPYPKYILRLTPMAYGALLTDGIGGVGIRRSGSRRAGFGIVPVDGPDLLR